MDIGFSILPKSTLTSEQRRIFGASLIRQTTHGIGTILDIVVNHTADVIDQEDGAYAYQYKFSKPYQDANGKVFDDRDYIDSPQFPKLDETVGFAAPPTLSNRRIVMLRYQPG